MASYVWGFSSCFSFHVVVQPENDSSLRLHRAIGFRIIVCYFCSSTSLHSLTLMWYRSCLQLILEPRNMLITTWALHTTDFSQYGIMQFYFFAALHATKSWFEVGAWYGWIDWSGLQNPLPRAIFVLSKGTHWNSNRGVIPRLLSSRRFKLFTLLFALTFYFTFVCRNEHWTQ